jgi:hypothetical protein
MYQQYNAMKSERQHEYNMMAAWKDEKAQYDKFFKTMQRAMADNPFVMVLIDGDGMIVSSARRSASNLRTD